MKGGCLCGAVRYETATKPLYQGFCHCRDCQKATGTGHCCYMIFEIADVTRTGVTKSHTVIADGGLPSRRLFCVECGSIVFGLGTEDDTRMSIYAGTLDDPDAFKPENHIFVRSRRYWDLSGDGLPDYEALP